jgi:hypothetical protein
LLIAEDGLHPNGRCGEIQHGFYPTPEFPVNRAQQVGAGPPGARKSGVQEIFVLTPLSIEE